MKGKDYTIMKGKKDAVNYKSMVILHNRIKCNHCGDIIESYNVHDFKFCRCNTVYVDGGHEYLRRGFNTPEDYTDMSESVEINKHGVNKNIKYNILTLDKMEELGFRQAPPNNPYEWYFCRILEKPKKRDRHINISLNIKLPFDPKEELDISVLDEDFLQPYDYQYILSQPESERNKVALAVRDEVEYYIDEMQKAGVLSGHKKGDYI